MLNRILGLDVGDKSIGVAISDESRTIARGVSTLRFGNLLPDIKDDKVRALIDSECVAMVVVGMPLDLEGREGEQAHKVKEFVDALRDRVSVPVVYADERFTSLAAARILREGGLTARKQRNVKDKVAAVILLQDFLNAGDFDQVGDNG